MATYTIPVVSLRIVRERTLTLPRNTLTDSPDSTAVIRALCSDSDRENLVAVFLGPRGGILGAHTIAIGGLTQVQSSLAQIFKTAIVHNASAIVLGHNHPSGDSTPSPEDIAFTRRAIEAGKLLGITVLDHIVVASDNNTSMLDMCIIHAPLRHLRGA